MTKKYSIQLGLVVIECCFLFSSSAAAGTISQTYHADTNNISQGALVSLSGAGNDTVELANSGNVKNLVGIATTKPILEISGGANTTVPVAVSGSAETLVSDINGTIKTGDKITASPVSGIGMKATASTEVVGTAQANLGSSAITEETVKKADGKNATIEVGMVPIAVATAYYSVQTSNGQGVISSFLPPFLQTVADAVAGKHVSPLKLLLGTTALLLGFIIAIVMLYSSIRTNIASIGRNPLAQGALRKGFVDVVIAAIGILIIASITTYIIIVV